ncbi:L,D-transpeptidase [Nostoc sp. FACHB-152]|uniref:L,D-transpeptidase n=1 Tax=unclassified Nostoc TaxID=2593658 RepID=UPI001686C6B1|nr:MULTISPECIES: L,D-transpeptidase [unclassified Nostoc]MBD2446231.1 L,D-transpeptidase [Nostoc sp. FACHB-152]MBD2469501.1 L,D-transpeptidase [Nostoc sp. FACHB-145]
MKSLINSEPMRHLKKIVLSAAISLSVISIATSTAASAKTATIKQTIQTLQKSDQRWIQVNLSTQRLIAWEGKKRVYAVAISTGKRTTPTRVGSFKIQSKYKSARMRGRDYDVAKVPYTMYYQGSYGIHGAYWHKKFGTPVSHGCINVAPNHAKWLFNWASLGTAVIIHK